MDEDRRVLRCLAQRGFSACRTHRLSQELQFEEQVPPLSARAGIPAGKGRPPLPKQPLGDVMDMPYSGNKLHPTQKPIPALAQLIRSFSLPGETVLDPFAGSGSTCAAALLTGRKYIGVEMDDVYFQHASERLQRVHQRVAV